MPLTLKSVEPRRGALWVRDGFRLFAKKPLAFTSLFLLFLLSAVVVTLVPILGGLVQMMSLPLLSLGFMVAAQSALLGGEVKPVHFIEPLRADPQRRRDLLVMCAIYGLCALAVLWLFNWMSDEVMLRLQKLMAKPNTPQTEVVALLTEPAVQQATIVGVVLGTALTVPFWHAPALVHWGRQGLAQSLFSSTLAMWRNKGAFTLYGLLWILLTAVGVVMPGRLLTAIGADSFASFWVLLAALAASAAFYVSLLFTFNDCFGSGHADSPERQSG